MRGRGVLPVRRALVAEPLLSDLVSWSSSVEAWPVGSHAWGHYAEQTEAGPVICRTENVSSCHGGFGSLVGGLLREVASSFLGAEADDFKDKINYKQPGGAGFRPHQDVLAYPEVSRVVSVLVAIDECTTTSGCLWMDPSVDEVLPVDGRGVVTQAASRGLAWAPAELAPGDALCIGGLVPHFSETNRSRGKRRVLVASYAPRDAGYTRQQYYERRRRIMGVAAATTDRMRISTLADFEGAPVDDGPPASSSSCRGACTHD